MKRKTRKRISRSLMALGLALILIGAGYEAANYPWRLWAVRLGWAEEQVPPDPPPLENATLLAPEEFPEQQATDEALPENGDLLAGLPQIQLTQLGIFKLPKLDISENLVEGTGQELLYGVGHMPGTAYPGQEGNCVIAGHRGSVVKHPFRHLDKVEEGDRILLEDSENIYTYEVYGSQIVEPSEMWVTQLQEGETAMVTLITCTPVVTFTHRLIVWGRLVETVPKSSESVS